MRKIFTGAAIGPQAALLAAVAMAADVADHQMLVLVCTTACRRLLFLGVVLMVLCRRGCSW